MRQIVAACLLAVALGSMSGCIAVGGTETTARPTVGQELIDLKSALDKGAMSPAEYQQKKAEILARK